jgi:hypothetical protein
VFSLRDTRRRDRVVHLFEGTSARPINPHFKGLDKLLRLACTRRAEHRAFSCRPRRPRVQHLSSANLSLAIRPNQVKNERRAYKKPSERRSRSSSRQSRTVRPSMNRGSTSLGSATRSSVERRTTLPALKHALCVAVRHLLPPSTVCRLTFKLRQHLAALPCDNFDLARFSFFHLLSRNAEA